MPDPPTDHAPAKGFDLHELLVMGVLIGTSRRRFNAPPTKTAGHLCRVPSTSNTTALGEAMSITPDRCLGPMSFVVSRSPLQVFVCMT